MAKTAEQLLAMTRLRLGEVDTTEGTWTDTQLYDILNQAQVIWCRHIFSGVHYPFRRLSTIIPCISGATIYAAPPDYLAPVSIYHNKATGNNPKKLDRKNLESLRSFGNNDIFQNEYGFLSTQPVSSGHVGFYQYYDEVGQTGTIVDEGVVSQIVPGPTQGQTQFIDENHQGLGPARVGDVVTNITDQSQAVITGIGSGIFSFDKGWHGGRSNYPQPGDSYIIQSREEHRFALEVWSRLTFPDLSIIDGVPNDTGEYTFTLDRDDQFSHVRIKFSTENLVDIEQDTRFVITITDEDNEVSEIASFQDARVGNNQIEVLDTRVQSNQLFQGQEYTLNIYQAAFDSPTRTPQAATEIELTRPPEDYLTINYIKRAAEFKIPESICELPDELHDGLVERAVITAQRYIDPQNINQNLLINYKAEIDDAKMYLANRQPPEIDYVEDDELGGRHTFTPGYSQYTFR